VSDDLKRLHDRLDRATAAECSLDSVEDTETARLREGWLALGQLLEAAYPAPAEPLELPQPAERKASVRRRLAGAAAVAAALLIGVTLVWTLYGNGVSGGASRPTELAVAGAEPVEPSVAGPSQVSPLPVAGELDWDDPLDDEIALAAQEVVRIQQDWSLLDDPFGPVHRGLDEMEEDLSQSPL